MGCSSSKSPAATIVDKKDLTGAADSRVSIGREPETSAEKKVAQTTEIDELAAEMHPDEPKANEPKSQAPQAQWPKAGEPKADEVKAEKPQAEKATAIEVCGGAQTHEQVQVDVVKFEEHEVLEEPKEDIAKEQIEIKVTGVDGPPAVCACNFWSQ